MNPKGLIESVAARTQLSTAIVRRVVKELAGQVHEQLDAGTEVTVPGLGRFVPVDQPARTRQTESGETAEVPARRVIRFRAKSLEARVRTREEQEARAGRKHRRESGEGAS